MDTTAGQALSAANTAWVLSAAALVLFMTPGLAFFYAGFVRSKNVLGTLMHSFITMGLVGVLWVVVGYSLAFGPDQGGLIGNFDFIGLKDVPSTLPDDGTVSPAAFMIFQCMFAIITPALITGAFAERAKFGPFLIFMAAWSLLIYVPVAHWVFATDGWLSPFDTEGFASDGINALDFAGGTAIHVNAGAAALAAALVFGKRKGYGVEAMEPHNVSYVVLGAGILWFGWFGFNAGSALGANAAAVNAFIVTNTAAAAAALTWMFASWALTGKASVIGAAAGAVAGLVAITPASGFVQPMESIVIGGVAGVLCYLAIRVRARMGLDDSLDVVGVHGVGGLWGGIGTGIFAVAAVGGVDGVIEGESGQMVDQLVAIGAVALYSFVGTAVILKALDLTIGIKMSDDEQELGMDATQHGERGYVFDETVGVPVYQSAQPSPTPPAANPMPRPETA